MARHDLPGNRKAEPGIVAEGRTLRALRVEAGENLFERVGRNARAVIVDDDLDDPLTVIRRDEEYAHFPVRGREGPRIVDEIAEDLPERRRVSEEVHRRARRIEGDPRLVRLDRHAVEIGDVRQQFSHIDRFARLAGEFRVKARGVRDIGDEAVHARDVFLDDAHQLFARLRLRRDVERFAGAPDGGQRVFQLMRDIGGETLDRLDAGVDRLRHRAQRRR